MPARDVNRRTAPRYVLVMVANGSAYALWRHEIRRCGRAALAMPFAIAAVSVLLAATAGPSFQEFLLRWLPGAAIPLAAGLTATAIVGREQAAELQATVAVPYPVTLCRRLTVLAIAVAAAATVSLAASSLAGGRTDIYTALTVAVLLAGAGARAALRRGTGPASVLVVTVWVAVLAMSGTLPVPPWVPAVVWTAAGLILLQKTVRLADGEIA